MICLAREASVSQATGHRYLYEGIAVFADQDDVLACCHQDGVTHVILDGTLIASDRVASVR